MNAVTHNIKSGDPDDIDKDQILDNEPLLRHDSWAANSVRYVDHDTDMMYDCPGSVRTSMRMMPQFPMSLGPGTTRMKSMKQLSPQSDRNDLIPSFGMDKSEVPVWAQPSYRDEPTPSYNMVSPMNNFTYRDDFTGGVSSTYRSSNNPEIPLFGVNNRFGFNDMIGDMGGMGSMEMNVYMSPMRAAPDLYMTGWALDQIPKGRMKEVVKEDKSEWNGTPMTTASHRTGEQDGAMENENINSFASVGSAHHPLECRPCAFYFTKGCINGADCRFCHEWHPPKKKKPMKEQKNLMIIARPDGKIEFMRCTMNEALRVL